MTRAYQHMRFQIVATAAAGLAIVGAVLAPLLGEPEPVRLAWRVAAIVLVVLLAVQAGSLILALVDKDHEVDAAPTIDFDAAWRDGGR